jgi:serine/threonine protein kinase
MINSILSSESNEKKRGNSGRMPCLMANIEGKPLDRTILPGGLPPRQVGVLVGKLAFAMQELHLKGVIHRNLKPANIIFNATGQRHDPVIVDLGQPHRDIALAACSVAMDAAGESLVYLAPEQLRGEPDEIGPACDIFALGVILYELLIGGLPPRAAVWAATGRSPLVSSLFDSAGPGKLQPAFTVICSRAMATQVSDRYQSMGELAAAITGFLRSPAAAPPMRPGGHPSSP